MEVLRHELMLRLRDVLRSVRRIKAKTQDSGTMSVLAVIDRTGSTTGKQLAGDCALDPSTISRSVSALVKAGLVDRTPDPDDGRASVLAVSPHGRQALDDLIRVHDAHLAEALRDWSADDLRTFAALLKRFSEDLETL